MTKTQKERKNDMTLKLKKKSMYIRAKRNKKQEIQKKKIKEEKEKEGKQCLIKLGQVTNKPKLNQQHIIHQKLGHEA